MTDLGSDKAHNAADPDWFAQAEAQMGDLFATIEEINNPSLEEAFGALDTALDDAKRLKRHGAP